MSRNPFKTCDSKRAEKGLSSGVLYICVKDNRESVEQAVALEKQLPKQDGSTCTAEQKAWGVTHSQQSLHSWNTSQQDKTERKQLFDVLDKLKEDLELKFTEMVNTIRAEISQAFASQKKSSTEPSLDSQYACVLTQLLQAQAEIRQDVQKVNERLEHLSSQVCTLEGAVSQHAVTSNAAMAVLPSTDTWTALSTRLDLVSSKLDTLISAEHHRDIILCKESHTDTFVSTSHLREYHCTPPCTSRDQAVPQPATDCAVENEESIYPDQRSHTLPSHGKNSIHVMPVSAHGMWTPSKLTRPSHPPRSREIDQPSVPAVYEPDNYGLTQKKRCTQPLSWSKATRRGSGTISALSTPIGRRRSSRIHKRTDDSSPVMLTDSPFTALNSHKPVLATESAHMLVSRVCC
eukprot:Em0013g850a